MRFRASSTGEDDEGKKSVLPMRMPSMRRKQRPAPRGDGAEAPVQAKIPEDDEDVADSVRAMTFDNTNSTPKPSKRKTVMDFFKNRHMHKDGKASDAKVPTRSATVGSRVVSFKVKEKMAMSTNERARGSLRRTTRGIAVSARWVETMMFWTRSWVRLRMSLGCLPTTSSSNSVSRPTHAKRLRRICHPFRDGHKPSEIESR